METATNLHPTTLCLRSGVLDGGAASAGQIVPLPGVANGRPRLSAQVTLRRRTTRRAGMAERGGGYALSFGGIRLACALARSPYGFCGSASVCRYSFSSRSWSL